MLGVPARRAQRDLAGLGRARQQALGQRRAVVGRVLFVADEADGSLPSPCAQRLAAALAGEARADDHDAGAHPDRPLGGGTRRARRAPPAEAMHEERRRSARR